MTLFLGDEAATLAAGARLGRRLQAVALRDPPSVGVHIHLRGQLGAGKTTLVRGLLRELGVSGAVKSPAYTLVEPYQASGLHLFHFDLYRIADPEELELLGARDHFVPGAVCLFEWPERGEHWLPRPDLTLHLRPVGDGRGLLVEAAGALGKALSQALAAGNVS